MSSPAETLNETTTAIIDGDPVVDVTTVEVLPDFLASHDAFADGPDA